MRIPNSGKSCNFCTSYNTFIYNNPIHIRNSILCGYCYAIENLSFQAEDKNFQLDEKHLTHLNKFIKNILNKTNHKDILIFDNFLKKEHVNFEPDINFHFIQNYDSIKNINKLLKYAGLLKLIVIPNLNLFDFKHFFNAVKDLLAPDCIMIFGIFREKYYTGKLDKNYHFIYNGFCIEKILEPTEYFVQSDFLYEDDYLIINIAKYEPSNYEIKELDTLTNNFITEDSNLKNIRTF